MRPHHHGQLDEDGDHGGGSKKNTACHKVPTGPDYGNLSVEVAEEIKNLLWYAGLECQMEYRTHTNS